MMPVKNLVLKCKYRVIGSMVRILYKGGITLFETSKIQLPAHINFNFNMFLITLPTQTPKLLQNHLLSLKTTQTCQSA
jgi:hypothetical protein